MGPTPGFELPRPAFHRILGEARAPYASVPAARITLGTRPRQAAIPILSPLPLARRLRNKDICIVLRHLFPTRHCRPGRMIKKKGYLGTSDAVLVSLQLIKDGFLWLNVPLVCPTRLKVLLYNVPVHP